MTRGIRNNNPLNIRRSPSNAWLGSCPIVTDKQFHEFTDVKYGFRAAFIIIRNYMKRHINSIYGIINSWAPRSDGNDVESYVSIVSSHVGLPPHAQLEFTDSVLIDIVRAMAYVESSVWFDRDVIEESYKLL